MSQPVVYLKNVSFRRKTRTILEDISWQIEGGRHWALLGANGSGKTTLLKIVTGYEWPTSGSVQVLGQHFGECSISELRKAIGWVSSAINSRLPQRDTALEIVVSGLAASIGLYREFTEIELSAGRNALAMVGAEKFADQDYSLLSQGEQQRVLIARGLVNEPKILILDEPCVGLDPAARQHLLSDLGEFAKGIECPSIIYVTHHIEEICPWITDVMLLKDGQVVAAGNPVETVTSKLMSEVFSSQCRVNRNGDEFTMSVS